LLDIGGDKAVVISWTGCQHEANPFFWGSAVSGSCFKTLNFSGRTWRAVLRLSADYQIRILVPMVTERSELVSAQKTLP